MTLVICQTFTSPSRTEVQRIMCEEEPWHVLRINHIMGERKPKKLSCFFPFLFHPVLGHCSCVDHKLPSTCRERRWEHVLIPETRCKAAAAYVGELMISFSGTAVLYGLHALSCISQNLTFSRRAPCMLFKIGFYEFRWAECLFTWFVIIYLRLCNDWVASLNSDL